MPAIPLTLMVFSTSDEADYLPDNIGGAQYIIDTTAVELPAVIPLSRSLPGHLRILVYTTRGDGVGNPVRRPIFARIIKVLSPDIIAFQEQGNAPGVQLLVASWLQDTNFHAVMLKYAKTLSPHCDHI